MKNKTISRIALAAMIVFFTVVAVNYVVLEQVFSYRLLVYVVLNLSWGGIIVALYRKWLKKSIDKVRELLKAVLNEKYNPEVNELEQAAYAIDKLSGENTKAIDFIYLIGRGDLDQAENTFSDSDKKGLLAGALLSMRDQLREVTEKEKERKWATEGLAAFSEILRLNNDTLPNLCNAIIARLVKYIGANQAAIFILNDKDQQQASLEMVACYAYERRKYLHKAVAVGEGLLGQAFLEKETLYITEIPQNYTSIKSGLGDATPGSLLIVPIRINENVLGVLEMASFRKLRPYQIEFVEKMSEGLASAIATAKINEQTSRLLSESQAQAQELKAQEEEMRQNMEELQATQEKSFRMQEELQRNEQMHLLQIEELNHVKQMMLEQEARLKINHEKSQKRSLMFKEKMEKLDIELEGKNAQIKTLQKKLQQVKEIYSIAVDIEY
jgi:GAF domain-containing protein